MKLRHYAYIMITISFVSTLLLAGFFIISEHLNSSYQLVEEDFRRVSQWIQRLETMTYEFHVDYKSSDLGEWYKSMEKMRKWISKSHSSTWLEQSNPELLEKIDLVTINFDHLRDRISTSCSSRPTETCYLKSDGHRYLGKVLTGLNGLSMMVQEGFITELNTMEETRSFFSKVQAGILFVLVIELFVTAFFIILQVIRPLKGLTRDFSIISEGNLDYRVTVNYSNEFGELMESFNNMISDIRDITASRNELEREIESRKMAVQENINQSERFSAILYNFPGILYVVDPDTREIQFVNKKMRSYLDDDPVGKICYREFQGYDLACHNCLSERLTLDSEPMTSIFHNNRLAMDLLLTEQIILWPDGREVLLKVGLDISQQIRYEKAMKQNQERLEALLGLYAITDSDEDEVIDYTLESAVKLSGSRVGYLHFVHESQMEIELFTWSRDVYRECTADPVKHYPVEQAGVWADCLRTGEPAIHNNYPELETRKGLPEGHLKLERHLSVPVYDGEKIVAIIGVGNKKEEYTSDDVRQLTLFIQGMWGILQRQRAERQASVLKKRKSGKEDPA